MITYLLSSYNRMENHAFRYEMEEYDLKEFVLEYLSENEEFARENKLQISLKAEMGNRMKMDKGAFKRIIDNLLTNSIRYRKKRKQQHTDYDHKKTGYGFLEYQRRRAGCGERGSGENL